MSDHPEVGACGGQVERFPTWPSRLVRPVPELLCGGPTGRRGRRRNRARATFGAGLCLRKSAWRASPACGHRIIILERANQSGGPRRKPLQPGRHKRRLRDESDITVETVSIQSALTRLSSSTKQTISYLASAIPRSRADVKPSVGSRTTRSGIAQSRGQLAAPPQQSDRRKRYRQL